ncbi:MAG: SGNH/GDSL hydrolase family protein [Geodermatophilaceae bacterium]|nr:SGNH/GDSL hydrolase family protein [Geodermatophilaceae bacterium]MDQ3466150.1 SGNH/GDSL hydrolase family protein [Actinomycetota bacterium]
MSIASTVDRAGSISRARRIATTTAYAGGGAGLLGAVLFGVLRAEARMARRRVLRHEGIEDPPNGTGMWGDGAGTALTLAMMGDSSAVGRGVDLVTETPGALLAHSLSGLAGRPVRLVQVAVSGSESSDLGLQVGRVLPESPDVAVIMIGANDVTARIRAEAAVGHLRQAVLTLRQADCEVVVATCPDLGTLRPIPQPLRLFGRRWSRQMAAAQTVAVVEAGGRTVSLGSLLGPEFMVRPELFSLDQFHPSAEGYAAAAAAMLPSVAAALEIAAPADIGELPFFSAAVRPIARAAARAAWQPGTEVSAASPPRGNGIRGGSLALSLRRRPAKMPTPEEAADGSQRTGAQTKGHAI